MLNALALSGPDDLRRRLALRESFIPRPEFLIDMVRPLRQRHRFMTIVATVLVPTAFALGIATRREIPASRAAAPGFLEGEPNQRELWNRQDLWEKTPIRTRLLRIGAGSGQLAVELAARDPIVRPDLLVYWLPGEPAKLDSLPNNAFLLGSFRTASPVLLVLPAKAARQSGSLVLYSLADQALVGVSKPFAIR